MDSAAGVLGNPGIVMISPVRATMNPAPADILKSRTVISKPSGLLMSFVLSEKENCVLAIHTGRVL